MEQQKTRGHSPIASRADVASAWDLAEHTARPDEVRRRILQVVQANGWEEALPAKAWSWVEQQAAGEGGDGSQKFWPFGGRGQAAPVHGAAPLPGGGGGRGFHRPRDMSKVRRHKKGSPKGGQFAPAHAPLEGTGVSQAELLRQRARQQAQSVLNREHRQHPIPPRQQTPATAAPGAKPPDEEPEEDYTRHPEWDGADIFGFIGQSDDKGVNWPDVLMDYHNEGFEYLVDAYDQETPEMQQKLGYWLDKLQIEGEMDEGYARWISGVVPDFFDEVPGLEALWSERAREDAAVEAAQQAQAGANAGGAPAPKGTDTEAPLTEPWQGSQGQYDANTPGAGGNAAQPAAPPAPAPTQASAPKGTLPAQVRRDVADRLDSYAQSISNKFSMMDKPGRDQVDQWFDEFYDGNKVSPEFARWLSEAAPTFFDGIDEYQDLWSNPPSKPAAEAVAPSAPATTSTAGASSAGSAGANAASALAPATSAAVATPFPMDTATYNDFVDRYTRLAPALTAAYQRLTPEAQAQVYAWQNAARQTPYKLEPGFVDFIEQASPGFFDGLKGFAEWRKGPAAPRPEGTPPGAALAGTGAIGPAMTATQPLVLGTAALEDYGAQTQRYLSVLQAAANALPPAQKQRMVDLHKASYEGNVELHPELVNFINAAVPDFFTNLPGAAARAKGGTAGASTTTAPATTAPATTAPATTAPSTAAPSTAVPGASGPLPSDRDALPPVRVGNWYETPKRGRPTSPTPPPPSAATAAAAPTPPAPKVTPEPEEWSRGRGLGKVTERFKDVLRRNLQSPTQMIVNRQRAREWGVDRTLLAEGAQRRKELDEVLAKHQQRWAQLGKTLREKEDAYRAAAAAAAKAKSRPNLRWWQRKKLAAPDEAVDEALRVAQEKVNQAAAELAQIQYEVRGAMGQLQLAMHAKLKVAPGNEATVRYDHSPVAAEGPGVRASVEDGTRLFSQFIDKSLTQGVYGIDSVVFRRSDAYQGDQLNARQSRGDRSWYMPMKLPVADSLTKEERWVGMIGLGSGDNQARAVVHGLGHWLESANPELFQKAALFLDQRVGRQPLEALQTTRDVHHTPRELAQDGGFPDPYFGRFYGKVDKGSGLPQVRTATELISMGMEWMIFEPHRLAREDPELFDFLYAVTHGG